MRGDELESLTNQKFREGKNSDVVFDEIEDLKESQIILKNNKREIKNLNKDNEELIKENEKLKSRIFNLQFKIDSIGRPEEEETLPNLNIIMLGLNGKDKLTTNEIAEECKIRKNKVNRKRIPRHKYIIASI